MNIISVTARATHAVALRRRAANLSAKCVGRYGDRLSACPEADTVKGRLAYAWEPNRSTEMDDIMRGSNEPSSLEVF